MSNVGLVEKIQQLPPDAASEVEDFVDFISSKREFKKRTSLTFDSFADVAELSIEEIYDQRAALLTFAEDWELPDMDVYDKL